MQHRLQPWLSLLLLILGGMAYVLFRPRTLLLFVVADAVGMGPWTDRLRLAASGLQPPDWVVFSGPGGLWAAAYIVLTDWLTQGRAARWRLLAALPVPLAGAVSELMQAMGLVPGTFDVGDLVCYLLPYILYGGVRKLGVKS